MEVLLAVLEPMLDSIEDFRGVARALDAMEADDGDATALRRAGSLYLAHTADVPDADVYPQLAAVEPEIVDRWLTALVYARHPVLVARLGDLCWLRRAAHPRPDRPGRDAIAAFLALAQRWDGLTAHECLVRAVRLARTFTDLPALSQAYAVAKASFDRWIEEPQKPGVSMRYLQLLSEARPNEHAIDLEPLFALAKARLGANPDTLEGILNLQRSRLGDDPAAHLALRREAAQGYFRTAKSQEGLGQLFWLQKAKAIAHDMPDLREELLRFERQFDPSAINWTPIEVAVRPFAEALEASARPLYEARSWQEAMALWLNRYAPCGDHENNAATADQIVEQSVLGAIAFEMALDPANGQARQVAPDQRLGRQLAEIEQRLLELQVEFVAAPFLRGLPFAHRIAPEPLQSWLAEAGAPAAAVRTFSNALFDWWAGARHLPSALEMTTALEVLIRHHAEQRGIVVTRNAALGERGGVLAMGDLISGLEGHLNESWRRFLRLLLVADDGLNLRNNLFHGLALNPNSGAVVALAWACAFLCRAPAGPNRPATEAQS